jgi:N-acetyltransferase 10
MHAGRFNERLVLSLADCPACILMDDEMNILPTSTHVRSITPVELTQDGEPVDMPGRTAAAELKALVTTLEDTQPAGALAAACRTLDQAKAVLSFIDAASEKLLRTTVALTASRGRGKSAAMGLAMAGAVALGYSNIFVTAPSPENLRTLFEFVFKGLDALEYKEHLDYDIMESTNPAFARAIVRVNIYRSHRQVWVLNVPLSFPEHTHQQSLFPEASCCLQWHRPALHRTVRVPRASVLHNIVSESLTQNAT